MEKDLQPILYNIYKKNLELETQDYAITRCEFLKAMVDLLENNTIFELSPILEEERWICFQPHYLSTHNKGFVHIWLNLNRTEMNETRMSNSSYVYVYVSYYSYYFQ